MAAAKKNTTQAAPAKKTAKAPAAVKKTPAKAAKTTNTKQKVVFNVFAPESKSVCVAGEFNSWNPEKGKMKKDKSGNWTVTVQLVPGNHQYKLVFDEIYWETDKSNPSRVPDGQGGENSVKNV